MHTDKHTDRQAGTQTDRQTDRHTDIQTDVETDRHDKANSRSSQFCKRAQNSIQEMKPTITGTEQSGSTGVSSDFGRRIVKTSAGGSLRLRLLVFLNYYRHRVRRYLKIRYDGFLSHTFRFTDHRRLPQVMSSVKADSHIACRAHAVPLSCRAVNSHMLCRAPAMLRQCLVLRESPCGSRKYPNC